MKKTILNDDSGTTAIEFALISVVFLSLIFGIFELGRAFLAWNSFQYAIEATTRYALANPDATEAELSAYVSDNMSGMSVDPTNVQVLVTYDTASNIDFIDVNGLYEFETVLPLLPDNWDSFTLTAKSRMPIPSN